MFLISAKPKLGSDSEWLTAMSGNRISDPKVFAEFMLVKTSRTFALNIQVLPLGLRQQVLLSYLFCRMADTLEDDAELGQDRKVQLLRNFKNIFASPTGWQSRVASFLADLPTEWSQSTSRWDRLLVAHSAYIFPQLFDFSESVVRAISNCICEMCDGMIEFTTRVNTMLIQSIEELDKYCYYVAGTVGNLLSQLFVIHSPLISQKKATRLNALSVSFGLGLQLTNILKDIEDDRSRNVSYIPQSLLAVQNLNVENFSNPLYKMQSRKIMTQLLLKAKSHLADALEYTCLLPRMEPRLRLFCLWPLFMALETLSVLADQSQTENKISRKRVSRIVLKTSLACGSNTWLRSMFNASLAEFNQQLEKK